MFDVCVNGKCVKCGAVCPCIDCKCTPTCNCSDDLPINYGSDLKATTTKAPTVVRNAVVARDGITRTFIGEWSQSQIDAYLAAPMAFTVGSGPSAANFGRTYLTPVRPFFGSGLCGSGGCSGPNCSYGGCSSGGCSSGGCSNGRCGR